MSRSLADIAKDGRYKDETRADKFVEEVTSGNYSKEDVKLAILAMLEQKNEEIEEEPNIDPKQLELAHSILTRRRKDWYSSGPDVWFYLQLILNSDLFKGTSRKVKREITDLQKQITDYIENYQ